MVSGRHVIRFGEFVVDLRARELHRNAARVRLQDQPFQILAMLLERRGELVTRDELRARLWPHGTYVDFEHSLNAAIKRLRLGLGDSANEPRYVETLPRRGYRFITGISAAGLAAATVAAVTSPKQRLAVLPLANLSGSLCEHLAAGLTEDLIAAVGEACGTAIAVLGRVAPSLTREIPRTAAIGEALRVDYLVEGSVRCEGPRVRIAARLIETASETQLWSATFDRALGDYLTVQAETARAIAQSIGGKLCPGHPPATHDTPTDAATASGSSPYALAGNEPRRPARLAVVLPAMERSARRTPLRQAAAAP